MDFIVRFCNPETIILDILGIGACILGDHLIQTESVAKQAHLRALVDSLTHGLIGLFSWSVVINFTLDFKVIFEIILCMGLAMAVDIDHFIAAGSMQLKDALHLPKRPPFHNSSLIISIFVTLLIFKRIIPLPKHLTLLHTVMNNLPWIFLIAWSTHHIRDATRRGLWFAPFGSTRPLPRWLYICLIAVIPLFLRLAYVLPEVYSERESTRDSQPVFKV